MQMREAVQKLELEVPASDDAPSANATAAAAAAAVRAEPRAPRKNPALKRCLAVRRPFDPMAYHAL